ncbi:putative intracellular protease/amidase [Bacillus oleivorans]|uniref:Putative intracellular protease/amidase n=1 Tax=Bacillus oleivorans TaxID=1448271 RepID=A0A285CUM9_9BACI|nr:DJ-1/PfpI family protein [Bacillus oleivorans]SNX70643.1 putative intracellular protease/amidase [Bacillus oleivorans]
MIKVLFFTFPLYADFEVAHPLFFLRKVGKAEITTVTADGKPVESVGGLFVTPQYALSDINVTEYNLVLLPGGDGIHEVINESSLQEVIQEAFQNEIPIASICASSAFLAKAGLLKGKKFTCTPATYEQFNDLFSDGEYTGAKVEIGNRFITAKGTAFPEFTIAMGNLIGMWRDEKQADFVYQFSKGNIN